MIRHLVCSATSLLFLACSRPESRPNAADNDSVAAIPQPASFKLTSSALRAGDSIPVQFTCDGANQSPPLSWAGAPPGTKSFALVVDDPDAPGGTFVHWVIYNVPATADSLPPGIASGVHVPELGEARQAENGFNKALGYGGPCPPKGPAHDYHFRLFALDRVLDVKAPASRDDVVEAMQGHEVGHTQLVAPYSRR